LIKGSGDFILFTFFISSYFNGGFDYYYASSYDVFDEYELLLYLLEKFGLFYIEGLPIIYFALGLEPSYFRPVNRV